MSESLKVEVQVGLGSILANHDTSQEPHRSGQAQRQRYGSVHRQPLEGREFLLLTRYDVGEGEPVVFFRTPRVTPKSVI